MGDYAGVVFKMQSPDKKGTSLLTTCLEVEKMAKIVPPELLEYRKAILPTELSSYWFDFLELSERRSFSESGPDAIDHVVLRAWADNNDIQITTFRQDMIFMLDRIWLNNYYENAKRNK